jgi:SAM-dependent methyltransferase
LAAWHAQRGQDVSDAEQQRATALDLGCGGGRDLAWICELGREQEEHWQAAQVADAAEEAQTCNSLATGRQRPPVWRCTGVDNLRPALMRASLLLADAGYPPTQPLPAEAQTPDPSCASSAAPTHGVDRLLWAQCSPDGALHALAAPPGCSSRVARLGTPTPLRPLLGHTFDLVLLVRFLPRAMLSSLDELVAPGGVLAISHFAAIDAADQAPLPHEYDSPPLAGRFTRAEVAQLLRLWNSRGTQRWHVLGHTIDRAEDGRPLRSVLLWRQQ